MDIPRRHLRTRQPGQVPEAQLCSVMLVPTSGMPGEAFAPSPGQVLDGMRPLGVELLDMPDRSHFNVGSVRSESLKRARQKPAFRQRSQTRLQHDACGKCLVAKEGTPPDTRAMIFPFFNMLNHDTSRSPCIFCEHLDVIFCVRPVTKSDTASSGWPRHHQSSAQCLAVSVSLAWRLETRRVQHGRIDRICFD